MAINFTGKALKLRPSDVATVAGYLGVEVALVRTVMAVESAGKGFGKDGRPIILIEPHVFYRGLEKIDPSLRRQAEKLGLAYKSQGSKPYPKTQAERYVWLERAMAINPTAALKSCSWGLGQVMGFNHGVCGFATVQEFVEAMCYSEGAQLYVIARFIVYNSLQTKLRTKNWDGFAAGYNGKNYKKGGYHTKLAQAYAGRPASEKVVPPVPSAAVLDALIGRTPKPILRPDPPVAVQKPEPIPNPKLPDIATDAGATKDTDVVLVDGPKQDETQVVIVTTPKPDPQAPAAPPSKTGLMAIVAIVISAITAAIKYFGG